MLSTCWTFNAELTSSMNVVYGTRCTTLHRVFVFVPLNSQITLRHILDMSILLGKLCSTFRAGLP